jgi:hypothetical protein
MKRRAREAADAKRRAEEAALYWAHEKAAAEAAKTRFRVMRATADTARVVGPLAASHVHSFHRL